MSCSIFNLSTRFWYFPRAFHKKFILYFLLAWF
jgi:hypothetical protein